LINIEEANQNSNLSNSNGVNSSNSQTPNIPPKTKDDQQSRILLQPLYHDHIDIFLISESCVWGFSGPVGQSIPPTQRQYLQSIHIVQAFSSTDPISYQNKRVTLRQAPTISEKLTEATDWSISAFDCLSFYVLHQEPRVKGGMIKCLFPLIRLHFDASVIDISSNNYIYDQFLQKFTPVNQANDQGEELCPEDSFLLSSTLNALNPISSDEILRNQSEFVLPGDEDATKFDSEFNFDSEFDDALHYRSEEPGEIEIFGQVQQIQRNEKGN